MKKLKTFQMDPTGSAIWKIDEISQNLLMGISSVYCYLLAGIWNIKLGAGCKFYGLTHFRRYPRSEIIVGNCSIFRSSFRSNFMGLNRACGISTQRNTAKIKIGAFCGFSGTTIRAYENITIGDHVGVGPNTVITDFDGHPISRQTKEIKSAPVVIDNDVWIGMNCTILKGVHIGKGSTIGANSVVTRSIPEMVIAAGSPARVIREIK
jgi:acetyltransferase-like isoleucine patch superfamily enzyme